VSLVRRHHGRSPLRRLAALSLCLLATACGGDGDPSQPIVSPPPTPTPVSPPALPVTGAFGQATRFTAELTVGTRYAYTSTWGTRAGVRGNAIFVWDVQPADPVLVDSVIVADAGTTGDVQLVEDANLLVVAIEPAPRGAIALYDVTDRVRPRLLTRYETQNTRNGVHTATVARVDGRLYAFLCINPAGTEAARLVIVDLQDPAAPRELWVRSLGAPFVHDVFVRDGILLTAEWDAGLGAWDIGGGGRGGTPAAPVRLGSIPTVGGDVHNVWWLRDAQSGARYAIVGEEGPGTIGSSASGDIHVVDVSDWAAMREVAYFGIAGAGTHNFWVDETAGILYAAYYNAGVVALDVRGSLAECAASARDARGRCDLARAGRWLGRALQDRGTYIWGVEGGPNGTVLATDMLRGLWRIGRATR
jgi:hypothetical protein